MKKHLLLLAVLLYCILPACKKITEVQTQYIYADTGSGNGPEYVITKYGAKGDGKTDCSAIINELIAKLPPSGGTIVIPEGDFLLQQPVKINRNYVTIRGLNPGLRSNVDVQLANVSNPGGGSKLIAGNASSVIEVPVIPDV